MSVKSKRTIRWEEDSIEQMAELVRISITKGKAVTISDYERLATAVPIGKLCPSIIWILKNEDVLKNFFPDSVAEMLSSKMRRSKFDSYADEFLRKHRHMTAREIGELFFMDKATVSLRAKKIGVVLNKERHRFSAEQDQIIKEHLGNIDVAASMIGVDRGAVVHRANFLGLHIPKKRFIVWGDDELKTLNEALASGKKDKEISELLQSRTEVAVALKRREINRKATQ